MSGIEPVLLPPQLQVEPAERRAAIAGDEALGAVPRRRSAALFQQQSHEGLDAAEQDRPIVFGVAAVEGGAVGPRPMSMLKPVPIEAAFLSHIYG